MYKTEYTLACVELPAGLGFYKNINSTEPGGFYTVLFEAAAVVVNYFCKIILVIVSITFCQTK